MPPQSPSLYNLKKTTLWFSFASIILLIGLVVMVLQDSAREWKSYQRAFLEYSHEMAEVELGKVKAGLDQKKLDELAKELVSAQQTVSAKKTEVTAQEKEITRLELEWTKAKAAYQDLKQFQDSDRYFFEEYSAQGHEEKAKKYEKSIVDRTVKLDQAKFKMESLEGELDQKRSGLAEFSKKADQLEDSIKKMRQEAVRLEAKVNLLSSDWRQALLNAPMLDFMKPTLQVQQIVLEHLQDDYFFAKSQKVDRCITCHLGIDQKGFEDAPQPFKTHPNLDLFLSPTSPHPMEEIGCTVCHGGNGQSLSFVTASHTPKDSKQGEEWEKKYHWHPMKHWAEKMLPLNHVEASCAKCHTGVNEVPKAPKLNEGRRLAKTFGCFNCHKVEGFAVEGGSGEERNWKAGPDLRHIQSKLEQDWMIRWLQNPKDFRPSTQMPRIFHLENTSDAESKEKNSAAIAAIATYLIKNSEPVSLEAPPMQGRPEEGERLVKEIGCLGCHTVGSLAANQHGPELSNLGSKVKADWLYTWIKNPKHYSSETRMPSLRLNNEEASHITSYLLSQRNEKFESTALPHVKPKAVDLLATAFLAGKMRLQEAKAELGKMSPEGRLEFVGKQSIAHQGCYSCHTIKGFENAKPIGTELTEEGSKEIERLDFGYIKIERTRQDWFFKKLKAPRIFDQGKMKPYHEKLKMPQFDFTDDQAEALTTFLLSLQKVEIPLEMQRRLSTSDEEIEAGRYLVSKMNCQGCHTLDGQTGKVHSILEDQGSAPPIIDGEGKKVHPEWLYHFLEKPTTIRPWLRYRMPSFDFNDKQLTTLIQYFQHLDRVPVSYQSEIPAPDAATLHSGGELFKQFQCIKCHQSKPDPALSASFLAPDLVMSKTRLRPDWVLDWLKDPQALMPGTMMPGFFPEGQTPSKNILEGDAVKQIKAIRDYLWKFSGEDATPVQAK